MSDLIEFSYHKHANSVQLSTIQHHGMFSTGEGGLNTLEGFGQTFTYLPLRPGLAVIIWALITACVMITLCYCHTSIKVGVKTG